MTMQQALETAYNDWNKQKANNSTEMNSNIECEVNKFEEKKSQIRDETTLLPKVSESELCANIESTTEIPFYYGNPTVDLVKGFIHIYKNW